MPLKYLSGRQFRIAVLLCSLLLTSVPGLAKAMYDFKLNARYNAQYPEDWYRPDPASTKFHVVPLAEKEAYDPVNIQIRAQELTPEEAALPDSLFILLQLEKHALYLEDNLNFGFKVSEPDSIMIKGAELAFHFSTALPGDPDAILVTDYARKGKMLYIFRFFCPAAAYEKYLTDYYLTRDGFVLK